MKLWNEYPFLGIHNLSNQLQEADLSSMLDL